MALRARKQRTHACHHRIIAKFGAPNLANLFDAPRTPARHKHALVLEHPACARHMSESVKIEIRFPSAQLLPRLPAHPCTMCECFRPNLIAVFHINFEMGRERRESLTFYRTTISKKPRE